jgi:hypothetical protein
MSADYSLSRSISATSRMRYPGYGRDVANADIAICSFVPSFSPQVISGYGEIGEKFITLRGKRRKRMPKLGATCGTGGRVGTDTMGKVKVHPLPDGHNVSCPYKSIIHTNSLAQVEARNRNICAHICVDFGKVSAKNRSAICTQRNKFDGHDVSCPSTTGLFPVGQRIFLKRRDLWDRSLS